MNVTALSCAALGRMKVAMLADIDFRKARFLSLQVFPEDPIKDDVGLAHEMSCRAGEGRNQ
jgi:hypothetical protein